MTESVEVDADAFKAAVRALLDAKPEPMAEILRKREPRKRKTPKAAKKRS